MPPKLVVPTMVGALAKQAAILLRYDSCYPSPRNVTWLLAERSQDKRTWTKYFSYTAIQFFRLYCLNANNHGMGEIK